MYGKALVSINKKNMHSRKSKLKHSRKRYFSNIKKTFGHCHKLYLGIQKDQLN